jgi:zeaxanthin epoxidase
LYGLNKKCIKGQGGCQAIEDAYVLTECLANTRSTEKIEDALQEFYRKRIVRVSIVQFLSRLASDLIINAFDTPWSPHDNLGQSWRSYLTFFWKPFLQYVIFPMQFAYLYSFHPSGSIRQTSKSLEAKWRVKHYQDAEAVFREADEGYIRQSIPSFFKKSEVTETVLQAIKE